MSVMVEINIGQPVSATEFAVIEVLTQVIWPMMDKGVPAEEIMRVAFILTECHLGSPNQRRIAKNTAEVKD